jgi:hypothetical protein
MRTAPPPPQHPWKNGAAAQFPAAPPTVIVPAQRCRSSAAHPHPHIQPNRREEKRLAEGVQEELRIQRSRGREQQAPDAAVTAAVASEAAAAADTAAAAETEIVPLETEIVIAAAVDVAAADAVDVAAAADIAIAAEADATAASLDETAPRIDGR